MPVAFLEASQGKLSWFCGFMLGMHRVVGRAWGPMLAALYAVPAVVWYPSLMLFFGLDAASKIAFGFLLGFFPIALAVLAGIRQVNPQLVVVARAYGAGTVTVFRRVMLPAMLFTLVGGLRTGLALCVIGVIVGEILGSRAGIGASSTTPTVSCARGTTSPWCWSP